MPIIIFSFLIKGLINSSYIFLYTLFRYPLKLLLALVLPKQQKEEAFQNNV